MNRSTLVILTACSGLGSFIPAVNLSKWLQMQGHQVSFHAIEQLYTPEALQRFLRTQAQCQKDLRTAILTQRWLSHSPQSIEGAIDDIKLENLLSLWQQNEVRRFIVFSGFWTLLLNRRFASLRTDPALQIDAIHLDVGRSLSWAQASELGLNHQWLLDPGHTQDLIPPPPVTPWAQRNHRIAVHGGGWHMGHVEQYYPKLREQYVLLIRGGLDATDSDHQILSDPDWKPWSHGCVDGGQFPPQRLKTSSGTLSQSTTVTSLFQQQLSKSLALVSKPGGASLIDSFATCTPLVLLPPFGDYEKENGQCWLERGFAVTFETWEASRFSMSVIEQCHRNLRMASRHRSIYGERYENKNLTETR
ncbi:hypothetical protein [Veronia pacifica]|uniref:UDP-glucuronosyltransferase n=1 Tax=Veronia pacifica TaxID=1080227 RepID=A0A1C3EII7_9GAMM|nr:hypothetical protein [Veronia pacifica]ODA33062.1 hypothetical protein A8L45_11495 [Veronia pacifica]